MPPPVESHSLEELMIYTTFHIGVYVSLTTLFIGASVFRQVNHPLLRFSVACFLVAGMCGGIIAANAAEYTGNVPEFFSTYVLQVWCIKLATYRPLATLEHLAFWTGLLPISLAYILCGGALFSRPAGS